MKKAKKMRCYKRLIHKQSLQVSSLCGTPFLSYLSKRFTQLNRALYGVAMLVHHFGAPTWRKSTKNIWNPLLQQKRFLFACELVYVRINISPNTWNVLTGENHKKKPFFQPDSFVTVTILVSRKVIIRKFKMLYFLNKRHHGTRNLQKDLFLGHLQPGVGKNSKGLAILILEFDDVTVKTIRNANCRFSLSRHQKILKSKTIQ